jgi:hypothetical protein
MATKKLYNMEGLVARKKKHESNIERLVATKKHLPNIEWLVAI